MLKALFGGHGRDDVGRHVDSADAAERAAAAPAAAPPSPRSSEHSGGGGGGAVLLSLPFTVTLREVNGNLDRTLAHGPLRILAPPSGPSTEYGRGARAGSGGGGGGGHEAAGTLRVGATEVPLGRVSAGKAGEGSSHTPPPPLCHRVDGRTLRVTLGSLGSGAEDGSGSSGSGHGGGSGGGPPAAYSVSSLLLIFPREATDHDVARTAAVLSDLSQGRGQLGAEDPAGAAAYGTPLHPPLSPRSAAAAGPGPGPADESLVLFHDPDPARSLGWKNSQPVRLTYLERMPTPPRGPHSLAAACGGGAGGGGDGGGGKGVGRKEGRGGGGRSLLGPQGAEMGSPGGTRLGKLGGLGLGSVWGSVAVANLAYEKDVRVRYSLDGWKSFGEVSANWDKRLGLGADNFNFVLDLDAAAAENGVALRTTLAAGNHVTLSLAVHYLVAGHEHWDNNEAANYTFDLPCE